MLTSKKNDNPVSFNLIKEAEIQILKTYDLASHLLSSQMVGINLEMGVGERKQYVSCSTEYTALLFGGLILPKRDVYNSWRWFLLVTVRWKMLLGVGGRSRDTDSTAKEPTMFRASTTMSTVSHMSAVCLQHPLPQIFGTRSVIHFRGDEY